MKIYLYFDGKEVLTGATSALELLDALLNCPLFTDTFGVNCDPENPNRDGNFVALYQTHCGASLKAGDSLEQVEEVVVETWERIQTKTSDRTFFEKRSVPIT